MFKSALVLAVLLLSLQFNVAIPATGDVVIWPLINFATVSNIKNEEMILFS
jgi:hypothetical protein